MCIRHTRHKKWVRLVQLYIINSWNLGFTQVLNVKSLLRDPEAIYDLFRLEGLEFPLLKKT